MSLKKKVIFGIGAIALITITLIGLVVYTQMKTATYNPFNGNTSLNNVYEPDKTCTTAPNKNLVLDHVQLVTSEEKVGENITAEELANFIIAVEQKTQQVFIQNDIEFILTLQFTIHPKDTYKVEIATQGDVSDIALQTLYDELQTLSPIYTKAAPIVFQLAFTVKASK